MLQLRLLAKVRNNKKKKKKKEKEKRGQRRFVANAKSTVRYVMCLTISILLSLP